MGIYGPVCAALLPNSRLVVDRFHVAKQSMMWWTTCEKKHAEVQGRLVKGAAGEVPLADVGIPP